MARKKGGGSDFDPQGYLVTFGDLVTLLLTFFVMLLSMKQPEVLKFSQFFSSFGEGTAGTMSVARLSRGQQVQAMLKKAQRKRPERDITEDQRLAQELGLPALAEDPILGVFLQPGLSIRRDRRGAVITLANDLAFASGSATLSPKAASVLNRVAELLRGTTVTVSIEGHTDNLPPRPGGPYRDNWALSLDRAEAVLNYLVTRGKLNPKRFRVGALGDSRPLASNATAAGRARNRRTEIVLLTKD